MGFKIEINRKAKICATIMPLFSILLLNEWEILKNLQIAQIRTMQDTRSKKFSIKPAMNAALYSPYK